MVSSAAKVLEKAADLIAGPDRWVRDYTAMRVDVDGQGNRLYTRMLATDPGATMWGGVGAIFKVGMAAGLTPKQCWEIQAIAARTVGQDYYFSDWAWAIGRTQGEVVSALRQAAEAAQ